MTQHQGLQTEYGSLLIICTRFGLERKANCGLLVVKVTRYN